MNVRSRQGVKGRMPLYFLRPGTHPRTVILPEDFMAFLMNLFRTLFPPPAPFCDASNVGGNAFEGSRRGGSTMSDLFALTQSAHPFLLFLLPSPSPPSLPSPPPPCLLLPLSSPPPPPRVVPSQTNHTHIKCSSIKWKRVLTKSDEDVLLLSLSLLSSASSPSSPTVPSLPVSASLQPSSHLP